MAVPNVALSSSCKKKPSAKLPGQDHLDACPAKIPVLGPFDPARSVDPLVKVKGPPVSVTLEPPGRFSRPGALPAVSRRMRGRCHGDRGELLCLYEHGHPDLRCDRDLLRFASVPAGHFYFQSSAGILLDSCRHV